MCNGMAVLIQLVIPVYTQGLFQPFFLHATAVHIATMGFVLVSVVVLAVVVILSTSILLVIPVSA
jgi:hypothetical protein